LFQNVLESIWSGVIAASDAYDVLHIAGNCVEEYPVVILGSREEIAVKGIEAQFGELLLTKPCQAPPPHHWDKVANERVRIAKFSCFVNGLDVAQL
jgi:hypothetical protein